jgi:hypothetical protein
MYLYNRAFICNWYWPVIFNTNYFKCIDTFVTSSDACRNPLMTTNVQQTRTCEVFFRSVGYAAWWWPVAVDTCKRKRLYSHIKLVTLAGPSTHSLLIMLSRLRVTDWVWIGWLDLLTPYPHDSELQAITAPSLIYTLYSSPLHTLGFSVFTSRILATDFNVVFIPISL